MYLIFLFIYWSKNEKIKNKMEMHVNFHTPEKT